RDGHVTGVQTCALPIYLIREPKAERVFALCSDLLQANARGLCITRIHPDDLRSRYPIEGAGFIWLSKSAEGPAKDMAVAEPSAGSEERRGGEGGRRGGE